MAAQPGETAIGVAAVGIGVLLLTAAYYDYPFIGKDGLLTYAFTHGTLPPKPTKKPPPAPPDKKKDNGPPVVEMGNQSGGGTTLV